MCELLGEDLDAAVAAVVGVAAEADTRPRNPNAFLSVPADGKRYFFRPSTSWNDGGPLIERFGLEIGPDGPDSWSAFAGTTYGGNELCYWEASGFGPTPLIAAMRALVEWKTPNVRAKLPAEAALPCGAKEN
jgi:hypothetical protein